VAGSDRELPICSIGAAGTPLTHGHRILLYDHLGQLRIAPRMAPAKCRCEEPVRPRRR
jgi:hypothetical protein